MTPPRPIERRYSARSLVIAAASTLVVFGGLALVIVNSPGWRRVQPAFFDAAVFWRSLPALLGSFWINVQLFLVAEVLILIVGLGIAILRSLPGPAFFPLRLIAT